MAFLDAFYQKLLRAAQGPKALPCLAFVAFVESSVFPIPPDLLLGPMVLSKPERLRFYSVWTTLWSVIGGLFGYWIGYYFFEQWGNALIAFFGLEHHYGVLLKKFADYGVWIILLAGFTPIPYKLFTLGAGAMWMPLGPFVLASIVGRGLRFSLVAWLLKALKVPMERCMASSHLGWWVLGLGALVLMGFIVLQS